MNIAVCIKRAPDMEQRFRVAPGGAGVEEGGLKFDMSDFDGYAVEVALQLTEKQGGEVVAISLGPSSVQETLRKAMSMGVARSVQLEAEQVPADPMAIAKALAAELQGGSYDLIMFGKHALDSANGAVGPMVAQLLDLPCVTACSRLEITDGRGSARRELEGAAEIIEFSLPAVVSIDEGIARPRYPALKGIMAAKKKPLEVKPAQLGESRVTIVNIDFPPERPAGKIVGEGPAAVPALVQLLQTEAKVL